MYVGSLLCVQCADPSQVVTRVLLNKSTYTDSVSQTPYFAGIISASILWVLYCWVTRLVQGELSRSLFDMTIIYSTGSTETQYHSLAHLMFALSVGLCSYNFFRAITLDPGTCPKPASDDELKSVCGHRTYLLTSLSGNLGY